MIRVSLLLLLAIMLGLPYVLQAEEKSYNVDTVYFEPVFVRNPFEPQLPKKVQEKKEVVITQPVPKKLDQPKPKPPVVITKPIDSIIPLPPLKVIGLIWNSERPQAIINGQVVEIGDIISEVEIMDIQQTGIKVLFHGRTEIIEP